MPSDLWIDKNQNQGLIPEILQHENSLLRFGREQGFSCGI